MMHFAHLMLADTFSESLLDVYGYVRNYGESRQCDFLKYYLCTANSDNSLDFSLCVPKDEDPDNFTPGLNEFERPVLQVINRIPTSDAALYLKSFFLELFRCTVTLENPGDIGSLNICIYLPAYDAILSERVLSFLEITETLNVDIRVDVVVITDDLAHLFESDCTDLPLRMGAYRKQTLATLQCLEAKKRDLSKMGQILLIQNQNERGVSLDLDQLSFVRIVGEISLLMSEHYYQMFDSSLQDNSKSIYALGLSVLMFDKYYFVQYLLHRAYKYILEREGVRQQRVDVNKISVIVKEMIKKHIHLFETFYTKEVEPLLEAKKLSHDSIIAQITPLLNKELASINTDFQTYISSPDLSLPEKKAVLAQLLGDDDDNLTGYMFNKKQLTIEDCGMEVYQLFIDVHNRFAKMASEVSSRKGKVVLSDYAVLSPDGEAVDLKLEELKSLRIKMRESSNYIREKSKELEKMDAQLNEIHNRSKQLTKDGFVFHGITYKMLPLVEEIPLEDNYEPLKENHCKSVDLRKQFTSIKDQGAMGTCTIFALTGIYESMLKKNSNKEFDLSEGFVYYNVLQKRATKRDGGTCFLEVVHSMENAGICIETLYPYEYSAKLKVPQAEAYEDAGNHRVVKAMNVAADTQVIKSALAEGYPVAISLKIYNSFGSDTGFITYPTKQEVQEANFGSHAMIVCGYSDSEKVFIVRNSWGKSFGDNGYCYIPYSYLGNPEFLNKACLIQEISENGISGQPILTQTTVSFDLSDAHIKSAILRNLIMEEELSLERDKITFSMLSNVYHSIIEALGKNGNRETLRDGNELLAKIQLEKLEEDKVTTANERTDAISNFKILRNRGVVWGVLVVLGTIIVCLGIGYLFGLVNLSYSIVGVILALVVIFGFLTYAYLKRRLRDLDDSYKQKLESIEVQKDKQNRAMEVIHLKMHIAGMIIDQLGSLKQELQHKYNGMQSFIGNLKVWLDEEDDTVAQMYEGTRYPFISLLSNGRLNHYFEERNDQITEDIQLHRIFMDQYEIDDKKIVRFKNELKQKVMNLLFNDVADFSMYSYLEGTTYSYLEESKGGVQSIFDQLEKRSSIFAHLHAMSQLQNNNDNYNQILFIHTPSEKDRRIWESRCSNFFGEPPLPGEINSTFKMTLLKVRTCGLKDLAI